MQINNFRSNSPSHLASLSAARARATHSPDQPAAQSLTDTQPPSPSAARDGLRPGPQLAPPRRPGRAPQNSGLQSPEGAATPLAQLGLQVRGWAAAGSWHQVADALAAASLQRRLDVLLLGEVAGQSLATCLLQALADAGRPDALPREQVTELGMAALQAAQPASLSLWLGLQGDSLATLVREHGGLARQAAGHVGLLRALVTPLSAPDRAAIFLANAAAIVRGLTAQLGAGPEAAALLGELTDSVLAHGGPDAAQNLLRQAPALLVAGRGRPEMEAIGDRLRAATNLVATRQRPGSMRSKGQSPTRLGL